MATAGRNAERVSVRCLLQKGKDNYVAFRSCTPCSVARNVYREWRVKVVGEA